MENSRFHHYFKWKNLCHLFRICSSGKQNLKNYHYFPLLLALAMEMIANCWKIHRINMLVLMNTRCAYDILIYWNIDVVMYWCIDDQISFSEFSSTTCNNSYKIYHEAKRSAEKCQEDREKQEKHFRENGTNINNAKRTTELKRNI